MKSLPTQHRYLAVAYLLLVLLGMPGAAIAQTTTIEGVVTDIKTKEKLPFVSVSVPQAGVGTNTDEDGHYTLRIPSPYTSVVFAYLGYRTVTKTIVSGVPQEINVALASSCPEAVHRWPTCVPVLPAPL